MNSTVSTNSMPSPTMVSSLNVPQNSTSTTPNIAGYIRAVQAQGASSDSIYTHLKQLGYVDSTGAITATKQVAPKTVPQIAQEYGPAVVKNLTTTFQQGGQNAVEDITNIPKVANDAGGTLPDYLLATTAAAGHEAGNIAGTAGGIIGSAIEPLLPDSVKSKLGNVVRTISDKVNSIPGMTPEIAKSLSDVFNTTSLLGGAEVAPSVADATKSGTSGAIDLANAGVQKVSAAVGSAADTAKDAASTALTKVKDLATPDAPPTMQTLIDRVKGTPAAKDIAQNTKDYLQTAKDALSTTGAKTPLDVAAGQFKKAMAALKTKMNTVGEKVSSSLARVATAKASGVRSILQNLIDETSKRIGAVYTPLTEDTDAMKGMSFGQRTQYLNDIIDGTKPSPFANSDGVFSNAPGREMAVSSATDLKKLADLHETLANLGDSPTVQQLHDTVQRLQSDLYKSAQVGAAPIDSTVKGLMKSVSGQLNETAKNAAMKAEDASGIAKGTYADTKAEYGKLADLQNTMSRRLGANYKNGASLIKRIFSPQNGDLNASIAALEKATGVPIFDHATMADFAMRTVEDPRIRSLLETKLGSAKNIAGFWKSLANFDITKPFGSAINVAEGATKFLQDPEGKIMRQLK